MKSPHLRRFSLRLVVYVSEPRLLATFLNSILFKAIQTARMELKLSQKDVAAKINEKPSILQDYESSKAIPNPQILGKLERVLGVKLRGKLLQLRCPASSISRV